MNAPPLAVVSSITIRLPSAKGSGSRMRRWTTLKSAVFAPMPSAHMTTAAAANPGARARELPQPEANVLPERREEFRGRVTAAARENHSGGVLVQLGWIAELRQRFAFGLAGGQSASAQRLGAHLEMEPDLVVDFAAGAIGREREPQVSPNAEGKSHLLSPPRHRGPP